MAPKDDDERWGEVLREIAALNRRIDDVGGQLDGNFPPLRVRGHDISNSLQPIKLEIAAMKKTIQPLIEKVAAVEQIRTALDAELSAMKSVSRSIKWVGGVLGPLVIALTIWVVTTTRDLQDETEQHGTQIADVRTSQREIREDAQGTRDAVAGLVVRIERADARDAERWEGVRATLERLEKRRR